MDDSARHILRMASEEFAAKLHDLAGRLDTNMAEARHRERKRASEADEDAMDDGETGWQTAQRRRGISSASGGRRAQDAGERGASPRRAGGTPQEAPAAVSGTLARGTAESAERPNPGEGGSPNLRSTTEV